MSEEGLPENFGRPGATTQACLESLEEILRDSSRLQVCSEARERLCAAVFLTSDVGKNRCGHMQRREGESEESEHLLESEVEVFLPYFLTLHAGASRQLVAQRTTSCVFRIVGCVQL